MIPEPRYRFYDRKPAPVDTREEVLAGLTATPKTLSPKYFYDEAGSELFEAITELPVYYLTRTEIGLFEKHADEIAARIGSGICLVEFGSGSSRKIRLLLENVRPKSYVPIDISRDHLEAAAQQLHDDYPWLQVYPTSADFTGDFDLPETVRAERKVAFFPGSSIGNFEPQNAVSFLRRVGAVVGPGGLLLIGVDRKKDRATLEAAYDDAAGVTAEFNLNALHHLNAELEADFDTSAFRHVALYNEDLGCIQMFLESKENQSVRVAGETIEFAAGERVHTENSFKYTPEEFTELADRAGFSREVWWTDAEDRFAIYLLVAR